MFIVSLTNATIVDLLKRYLLSLTIYDKKFCNLNASFLKCVKSI